LNASTIGKASKRADVQMRPPATGRLLHLDPQELDTRVRRYNYVYADDTSSMEIRPFHRKAKLVGPSARQRRVGRMLTSGSSWDASIRSVAFDEDNRDDCGGYIRRDAWLATE